MTDPTPEMLREDASDGIQYEAALAYASAWTADRVALKNVREGWGRYFRCSEARIEALEIEVATWRVLAGPMWMGDESEGHFVCLACNQPGADDGGCKTIQHLPDCEYAAALATKEEK